MKSTILYSSWLSTVSRHFSEFFSCPPSPICRESWQWTEYQWDGRRNRGIHAPIKEKWRTFKTAFRLGGALPAKTFNSFPVHAFLGQKLYVVPGVLPGHCINVIFRASPPMIILVKQAPFSASVNFFQKLNQILTISTYICKFFIVCAYRHGPKKCPKNCALLLILYRAGLELWTLLHSRVNETLSSV
jgi:hypothetical protein